MRNVDALVLGAGPAGGMTALLLARQGRSVLLCEAAPELPERVCGMYLCPAGVALLERAGVRGAVVSTARPLRGMVMASPDFQRIETSFPAAPGMPDHGLALVRPAFDAELLRLAREAGAEVRMGARPTSLRRGGDGWLAMLPDGSEIRARLLVGADGRKSSTAKLLGVALPPRRSRLALHLDLPARTAVGPRGQMHIFADGSYAGLNPVTPHVVNFSLVCDPAAVRNEGAVALIDRQIASSPHLREMFAPLPPTAQPRATYPLNARVRSAGVEDAALVGDASGYIDPLTGEGIYGALWTATELAHQLERGWEQLPRALHRYARARARRHRAKAAVCELFQHVIRRPRLANSVRWVLARRQEVADSFIGIVGNSYPPARGLVRMAAHALPALFAP